MAVDLMTRIDVRHRIEVPALLGHTQGHKLTHKWTGEGMNRVSAASKKQVTPRILPSKAGCIAARTIRAFDPGGREVIRVSQKGESCTISCTPRQ